MDSNINFVIVYVVFVVRAIGKAIYNQTPAEGINESNLNL